MIELFDQRRYLIPFRSQLLPHVFTDVLVIGGGVAGMRAAIEAAGSKGAVVVTGSLYVAGEARAAVVGTDFVPSGVHVRYESEVDLRYE